MHIHRLLSVRFTGRGDRVAYVFRHRVLSYGELQVEAARVAQQLLNHGVGPNVPVGIYIEHSLELPAAVLGVLEAGGACFPLSPKLPRQRLRSMLSDVRPGVILTQQHLRDQLPPDDASTAIAVDDRKQPTAFSKHERATEEFASDNLAFIIHTSGTTGIPHPVMLTHRAVVTRLMCMLQRFPLNSEECDILVTPISFVGFIDELMIPLLIGMRSVIADRSDLDSRYLIRIITQHQVGMLRTTPSLLQALLEDPHIQHCRSLKVVVCSGETLPRDVQKTFFSLLDARLISAYGCTESPGAMSWQCQLHDQRRRPTLGRPNTPWKVYVLRNREVAPVDEPGEIYIGGPALATGYYRQPDLTRERFIEDPFDQSPQARLYRTGDIGCYRPDGTIEFVGRADEARANIRGVRIDLREVADVLMEHPAVRRAMALVCDDNTAGQRLVAFWVAEQGLAASVTSLRMAMANSLPESMIPARFVQLEHLPLLPSGKIDRGALSLIGQSRPELDMPYVTPRSEVEEKLVQIWMSVLDIEFIGIDDNFLELGGDSIRAMQVISRIRAAFHMDMSAESFFAAPTIAELAREIATSHA